MAITVTTYVDDLTINGDCSLREAIQAANTDATVDSCPAGRGVDTILLPSGTYVLALTGRGEDDNATGDLDIRSNLVISGAGADSTTIDAGQIDRALHVFTKTIVSIRGVTIQNGKTADGATTGCGSNGAAACDGEPGGGIYSVGLLSLEDVTVGHNYTGNGVSLGATHPTSSTGGGDGGGIYSAGTLTLTNSMVTENHTGDGGDTYSTGPERAAGGGNGGGIFISGRLVMTNSTVTRNGTGDGGYSDGLGGFGGGIANENGVLSLYASQVTDNTTGGGSTWFPYTPTWPGGSGGGLFSTGVLTATECTIDNNHTSGYGSAGGILNHGNAELTACTVRFNNTGPGGAGGGIVNTNVFTLTRSAVSHNATGDGKCIGRGCGRSGSGGGILNTGSMIVEDSIVHENKTGNGGGSGGGIRTTERLTVVNSVIDSNHTGVGASWALPPSAGSGGDGGGISNQGTLTVRSSTVASNTTGAGVCSYDRCADGGAGGGISNRGTAVIKDSTVTSNETGPSGGCHQNGCSTAGGAGGGIFSGGIATVENSTIVANETGSGRCSSSGCGIGGSGGGIANQDGEVRLRNMIFSDNHAASEGPDCWGSLSSAGYNFVQNTSGCTLSGYAAGNVLNRYAWLEPLADNGGPTPTHALRSQSPALNAGSCTDSNGVPITADQRGQPRPQGKGCDIGAFESGLSYIPPFTVHLPIIELSAK